MIFWQSQTSEQFSFLPILTLRIMGDVIQNNFLTASWSNLIMANYELDAALLEKHLPVKTELDQYQGKNFVSLVGFQFFNTRVLGIKIPFHVNFEEVNLRFYVRRKFGNEWRRGVVFISEIVPKHAIAFIANTLYHENYKAMPMQSFVSGRGSYEVEYRWKFEGDWNSLKIRTSQSASPLVIGSMEECITEHYWGYNKAGKNKTTEYQVIHPRWNVYPVEEHFIHCNFARLYDTDFAFLQDANPHSVFLADGSDVSVRMGTSI